VDEIIITPAPNQTDYTDNQNPRHPLLCDALDLRFLTNKINDNENNINCTGAIGYKSCVNQRTNEIYLPQRGESEYRHGELPLSG
jgi:hypothetical protein